MIFFFDRSVGRIIPQTLVQLNPPVQIEYYDAHFLMDEPDDEWLPIVGSDGWFVIGQDSHYHLRPNELAALKLYNVGCFYLGDAEQTRWETIRIFMRAFDKIVKAAEQTPLPFVFRVDSRGRLTEIYLT